MKKRIKDGQSKLEKMDVSFLCSHNWFSENEKYVGPIFLLSNILDTGKLLSLCSTDSIPVEGDGKTLWLKCTPQSTINFSSPTKDFFEYVSVITTQI